MTSRLGMNIVPGDVGALVKTRHPPWEDYPVGYEDTEDWFLNVFPPEDDPCCDIDRIALPDHLHGVIVARAEIRSGITINYAKVLFPPFFVKHRTRFSGGCLWVRGENLELVQKAPIVAF